MDLADKLCPEPGVLSRVDARATTIPTSGDLPGRTCNYAPSLTVGGYQRAAMRDERLHRYAEVRRGLCEAQRRVLYRYRSIL